MDAKPSVRAWAQLSAELSAIKVLHHLLAIRKRNGKQERDARKYNSLKNAYAALRYTE
jgi:hypothetical protein